MTPNDLLPTQAAAEAAEGLLEKKHEFVIENIKETDWDTYEYLDIAFYPNYETKPLGRESIKDIGFSVGVKAMDVRYRHEPNDYEFYERISDFSPEVIRFNKETAQEVLDEWD